MYLTQKKLEEIETLNMSLKIPKELPGRFLPPNSPEKFDFMFIAEMPSINMPKKWDGVSNYNFDVTKRDKFFQKIMTDCRVAGSYTTDIVKERKKPGKPLQEQIEKWQKFLLREIEIIKPKNIVVLGKRTYEKSFEPFVKKHIPKNIKVDYVFHYSTQVPKNKFEERFKEIIDKLKNG